MLFLQVCKASSAQIAWWLYRGSRSHLCYLRRRRRDTLHVISSATQIRMFKVCVLLRGSNIQGKLLSKRDPPMNSRLAHNIKAESQITSYIVAPKLLLRILKLTYVEVS